MASFFPGKTNQQIAVHAQRSSNIISDIELVQGDVNSAQAAADAAQADADAAGAAAQTADTNAGTAQNTANTALTNAGTAQSTADDALTRIKNKNPLLHCDSGVKVGFVNGSNLQGGWSVNVNNDSLKMETVVDGGNIISTTGTYHITARVDFVKGADPDLQTVSANLQIVTDTDAFLIPMIISKVTPDVTTNVNSLYASHTLNIEGNTLTTVRINNVAWTGASTQIDVVGEIFIRELGSPFGV
jgi:hypothetical protein